MPLHLYNTLSGKVEEFQPSQDNTVRMYACGLTVYDYGHIGNFRTFVAVDLLRRFLKYSGYQMNHVMNITDVDDKIIRNAAKAGVSVHDYTAKYETAFLEDMDTLNNERPEHIVRATDHIQEMAAFIQRLEQLGYAYRTEDGSYYYRIAKFPEYGKLSKKDFGGMIDGARVEVDEYEKDSARDFALWKSPKPGEAKWDTVIGEGRPGWHIECSVMAMEYLGDSFDLHAGGEDLVFPHHENEIAQSEAYSGKQFARFWMHCRFLLVEGEKMSKSLGNFYTLRDLLLKGHKASAIRYLLASVPYRKQLNFTFDGLRSAEHSVARLRTFKERLSSGKFSEGCSPEMHKLADETRARIRASMEDDLNTAQALGAVFDMVREANSAADKGELKHGDTAPLLQVLHEFDQIFGVIESDDAAKTKRAVDWAQSEGRIVEDESLLEAQQLSDADVESLLQQRAQAKKSRDFSRADAIRQELTAKGIIVEDSKEGVRWKRK
ncbi:MAG TPA: cysteine--tRNA ligase [Terriglobales bacterium]|jgi:cysteinyl-tRNA synthetase